MAETDSYTIKIDGSWSLEDFYELPHVFAQVYAFHCAFLLTEEARDRGRLADAFSYPWQGGYSTVNFYTALSSQVPLSLRPQVIAIQYASPGFLQLGLWAAAATAAGTIVKQVVNSAGGLNRLYNDIYKASQERKLLGIEVKRKALELRSDEVSFLVNSARTLAEALGFGNLEELNELTGNPLTSMKILLSYYRRIRTLADYESLGKADFPSEKPRERLDK